MNWLRRWWPALVWAIVISLFSTHTFTAENTGHVIIPILHSIFPSASADSLERMHFFIRKSGHFTEYFIFALLVLRGIRVGHRALGLHWVLAMALLVVAAYASLDEFHQSFVPGRTAAVRDVMIDTTGGASSLLIAGLLSLWAGVRERNRNTAAAVE
jgi:VanZ family protein